ncbi:MAG TPA: hypothetical protein VMO47_10950 [Rhodothermales bacterium]|nr:hypothetical protein [Rhodothermales bacterium]
MTAAQRICIAALTLVLMASERTYAQELATLQGKWTLVPHKSADIDLWGTLSLEIDATDNSVHLVQHWGRPNRRFSDTLNLKMAEVNQVPIHDRVFASNVFMGLSMPVGEMRSIEAEWVDTGAELRVTERFPILGSQGRSELTVVHTYSETDEAGIIEYRVDRSSRPEPITYLMKREGSRDAFFMEMTDDWTVDGDLPEQAFLISLQALANEESPNLYFVYGEKWDFRFTPAVKDFLQDERFYSFQKLSTSAQALDRFKDHAQGYVVWDKDVRTSLIVSYTVAGLERAVVVSEELIPMAEKAGLPLITDFRGRFTGQTDAEIYQWAYDQYWERCSKEYIVWLGGEHGEVMRPGVADFGMKQRMFFNDLSTKPADTLEYALANRLFAEMKPSSLVMGWHSYRKDRERDHVKLASSYGHRVEGLHTLPNMSFMHQIPLSPGFVFENNHNVQTGEVIEPADKVYVAAVQTDALGIGAWTRPGRGQIPYAWEVTMNWSWLAPAMMEYFYRGATPNDYFIGCLSGPGYMYPKAIPADLRPPLIRMAADLMDTLDLRVFDIMDYSEGATVEGNTELTREVVDDYYEGMPNAIGFVNGYAPSYTYTSRDGRPLISFEYYLSESRSEDEAVTDLRELAAINLVRPYFLLLHIRQWSDITRVKAILDRLGPEFEVVPLDVFLTMAGRKPTFEERFLD